MTVALVTGGNTGIGRAAVLALAQAGFTVAVFFYEQPDTAQQLAEEVGGRAFFADLQSEEAIATAVAAVEMTMGPIGVLVNNAGVQERVSFLEMTTSQFERMMAVNTRGPFLMMKAVVPGMAARNTGRIINVASQTALLGRTEMVHYTASKGAVIAMTKSLARELAPHQILVNCVAPGPVTSGPSLSSAEERDAYMKSIPLERFATPEEVAETIVFLASGANYYTGQVLSPNGGEVM